MTRTQIQLPEPLFHRLKKIAADRDVSVAELIRRGMEIYVQTFPETSKPTSRWTMPLLRGSGGHMCDPATISAEAEAVELRSPKA